MTLLALGACTNATKTASRATTTTTTGASSTTTTTASPSATGTRTVSLYFARSDHLGTAHRDRPREARVATDALKALIAGPNEVEGAAGLTSSIPAGTRLLDLVIDHGAAQVDLSKEFTTLGGPAGLREAQVVFTLTQFPTVQTVTITVEGSEHASDKVRADFEAVLPAIFVESPAVGDEVHPPVTVSGTANTFEATLRLRITDDVDTTLLDQFGMATSGSGTRGTFSMTLDPKVDRVFSGKLVAYESSAKDGSEVNVVEIPLRFAPA